MRCGELRSVPSLKEVKGSLHRLRRTRLFSSETREKREINRRTSDAALRGKRGVGTSSSPSGEKRFPARSIFRKEKKKTNGAPSQDTLAYARESPRCSPRSSLQSRPLPVLCYEGEEGEAWNSFPSAVGKAFLLSAGRKKEERAAAAQSRSPGGHRKEGNTSTSRPRRLGALSGS